MPLFRIVCRDLLGVNGLLRSNVHDWKKLDETVMIVHRPVMTIDDAKGPQSIELVSGCPGSRRVSQQRSKYWRNVMMAARRERLAIN
jgi:hypothetical protein